MVETWARAARGNSVSATAADNPHRRKKAEDNIEPKGNAPNLGSQDFGFAGDTIGEPSGFGSAGQAISTTQPYPMSAIAKSDPTPG